MSDQNEFGKDGGEHKNRDHWKSFTEEVEIAGRHLVDEVTRLISEGNVRKLRVRSANDDVVLEVPLTAGAVIGGVFVLGAPWLAILGALAGVLAKVKLEVVRDADSDDENKPDSDAA